VQFFQILVRDFEICAPKNLSEVREVDASAAGQVFPSLVSIASVVLFAHRIDGTGGR